MAPQPLLQFVHLPGRHSDHFPASVLAGRYGNGGSGQVQKICRNFDAGMGAAFIESSLPGSFPKNCCPHPDAGRSFFNRDFKIVGHAHRQHIRADRGQVSPRDLITQRDQSAKVRPRFLRVFAKWRDSHQSAKFELLEPRSGGQDFFQVAGIGKQSAFRGFTAHVDLYQDRQLLA